MEMLHAGLAPLNCESRRVIPPPPMLRVFNPPPPSLGKRFVFPLFYWTIDRKRFPTRDTSIPVWRDNRRLSISKGNVTGNEIYIFYFIFIFLLLFFFFRIRICSYFVRCVERIRLKINFCIWIITLFFGGGGEKEGELWFLIVYFVCYSFGIRT